MPFLLGQFPTASPLLGDYPLTLNLIRHFIFTESYINVSLCDWLLSLGMFSKFIHAFARYQCFIPFFLGK